MKVTRVSRWEEQLDQQLLAMSTPRPTREHKFHPVRRWRFDFAWPELKIAVEVEGGVWAGGRHTRGSGFSADAEKYNCAARMGWLVLRYTDREIRSGHAATEIAETLRERAA